MKLRFAILSLAMIICISSIFFFSCGREKLSDPDNPSGSSFTIGTITPLDVNLAPGGEIADPISGGTFLFPEGGSGLLEV
ncbi:MAG: hypothetical protein KJ831_03890, partial [Candidatus Eisenbacteria bacterium]|nr:hypothetical protein [Candidatus Eisenbacteria bacterium]